MLWRRQARGWCKELRKRATEGTIEQKEKARQGSVSCGRGLELVRRDGGNSVRQIERERERQRESGRGGIGSSPEEC